MYISSTLPLKVLEESVLCMYFSPPPHTHLNYIPTSPALLASGVQSDLGGGEKVSKLIPTLVPVPMCWLFGGDLYFLPAAVGNWDTRQASQIFTAFGNRAYSILKRGLVQEVAPLGSIIGKGVGDEGNKTMPNEARSL